MNITLVFGIIEIIIIGWYILAKKNPQKYAQFLKSPYKKKRGLICLCALFLCGFINIIVNPVPPTTPASQILSRNNLLIKKWMLIKNSFPCQWEVITTR